MEIESGVNTLPFFAKFLLFFVLSFLYLKLKYFAWNVMLMGTINRVIESRTSTNIYFGTVLFRV